MKNQKGFTLIELLIVIAIIGILAVAFVPTLLDAPSRGRDSQRVANLNTIRTVLLDADLRGEALPASGCVLAAGFGDFTEAFGGNIPADPLAEGGEHNVKVDALDCDTYAYVNAPSPDYSIGLYARMETEGAGNVSCDALGNDAVDLSVAPGGDDDSCYAILVQ